MTPRHEAEFWRTQGQWYSEERGVLQVGWPLRVVLLIALGAVLLYVFR